MVQRNGDSKKEKYAPVVKYTTIFIIFLVGTITVWALLSSIATGQGR